MCGTAPWEWEDDPFAYEAIATRCHGCMRKEDASEESKSSGTRIALVPKEAARIMRETPKSAPRRRPKR